MIAGHLLPNGDNSVSSRRLLFLLNQARHASMKFIDKNALRLFGITGVQVGALFYLKQHPNSSMKQMADTLNLDKSAVTGLIRRLQKLGLVEKQASQHDGRAVVLNLTKSGLIKISEVTPFLIEFNESIEQDFSEDELDIITRYLNKMRSLS